MLFYASLFVVCVILSAVVLWLYRSMAAIGKAVYRAFLPSSKENIGREKQINLSDSLSSAQTPWGWSSHSGPRRALPVAALEQQNLTAPWGWPGSQKSTVVRENSGVGAHANAESASSRTPGSVRNNSPKPERSRKEPAVGKPMVGWPYREESFEFAGKQFKVIRKRNKSKTNLGAVAKPWGW